MTEARKAELHRVQEQIEQVERELANLRGREGALLGRPPIPREPISFQLA